MRKAVSPLIRRQRRNLLLLFIPLVLFGILSCAPGDETPEPAAEPEAVSVETQDAQKDDIVRELSFSARVEAEDRLDLGAEATGEVETIAVDEGDSVDKGDPLVTLHSEALQIQAREARSGLESARAQLEDSEAALESARRETERLRPLYEAGAISEQEWDQAKDELAAAERAAKSTAPAAVQTAQAVVDAAEEQLDAATLTAPIEGEVAWVDVSVGDQVSTGTHLVSIVDTDTMKIQGLLSERQRARVDQGMPARVTIDAHSDAAVPVSIHHIASTPAPSASGYPITLHFDDRPDQVRAGMTADVTVEIERAEKVVRVPAEALIDADTDPAVFVVEDGKAKRRAVEVGLTDGTWAEIQAGVKPEDAVVTTGQTYLTDGAEVDVIERNDAS